MIKLALIILSPLAIIILIGIILVLTVGRKKHEEQLKDKYETGW